MEKTFQVTREDNCIWIKDLRDGMVRHIVPEQAEELRKAIEKAITDNNG